MPARAEGVTEIRVGIGNEFGRYGKPLTFAREPEPWTICRFRCRWTYCR